MTISMTRGDYWGGWLSDNFLDKERVSLLENCKTLIEVIYFTYTCIKDISQKV